MNKPKLNKKIIIILTILLQVILILFLNTTSLTKYESSGNNFSIPQNKSISPQPKINQNEIDPYLSSIVSTATKKYFLIVETKKPNLNSSLKVGWEYREIFGSYSPESAWEFDFLTLDYLKYSISKNQFIERYGEGVNLSFQKGFNSWSNAYTSAGGGWHNDEKYAKSLENGKKVTFNLTGEDSKEIDVDNYDKDKRHSTIKMKYYWSDNKLKFKVIFHLYSKGTFQSNVITKFKPLNVTFNLKDDRKQDEEKIKKNIAEKSINFNSDTSPLMLEDQLLNTYVQKTNKQIMIDEAKKILDNSFIETNLDTKWKNNNFTNIQYEYIFNESGKKITVQVYDKKAGGIDDKNNFNLKVTIDVTISLTENYWNLSRGRLKIIPMQVYDPILKKLKLDSPEFDAKENKFIYHNSVKISFKAKNEKEKLYVNGEEIQVYNNEFFVNLHDNRELNKSDKSLKESAGNTYELEVKNVLDNTNVPLEMKFIVVINGLTTEKSLNYRWVGWDPNGNSGNSKEQLLLISEYILDEDGHQMLNPNYDPEINPKTGVRNETMFFESDDYPFYMDPVNPEGKIIPEDEIDDKQSKGFIADTFVSNSGVGLLDEYDKKSIDSIVRYELDKKTLKPKGEGKIITPNTTEQWSVEGLWHFVIYLKDNVEQEGKQWWEYQFNNVDVHSVKGTTIHKMIYISNKEQSYESFRNLEFIKNNIKVNSFWDSNNLPDSMQGKHLKYYLLNYTNIISKDQRLNLEYESVIRFWKQYVAYKYSQEIGSGENGNERKDISNEILKRIAFDTKNEEVIKNKVHDEIIKQMNNIFNAKENMDYLIYDGQSGEPDVTLEQMDLTDFINHDKEPKSEKIMIYSKVTSSKIIGKTFVDIVNIKGYDPNKVIDISNYTIKDKTANYFGSDQEFKDSFIDSWLKEFVEKFISQIALSNDIKYSNDYYLTLDIKSEIDLMSDDIQRKLITEFLNNNKDGNIQEISIKTNKFSLYLEGSNSFNLVNDITAEPNPEPEPEILGKLNLSTLDLNDVVGIDFSNSSEEIKVNFINSYILNTIINEIEKQANINKMKEMPRYLTDYEITVIGLYANDFSNDKIQLKMIETFLNSKTKTSLNVFVKEKKGGKLTYSNKKYTIWNEVGTGDILVPPVSKKAPNGGLEWWVWLLIVGGIGIVTIPSSMVIFKKIQRRKIK